MKFCRVRGLFLTIALTLAGRAQAQGFQLQQYESVAAGERGFVADVPWYKPTRTFAAAVTLNYGHDVLQGGRIVGGSFEGRSIVDHQLAAQFDLAYSPWERLRLSASLPLMIAEAGQTHAGVSPANGPLLSDPRLGLALRLYGDAQRDVFSAHLTGALWIPIGVADEHAGDDSVRGRVTAVFAGYGLKHLAWSTNVGALFREQAGLNANKTGPGTVGNELLANVALGYANSARSLHVGPEVAFGTVLGDDRAFKESGSHLEGFLSGTYLIADVVQVGAAVGVGIVRTPGTPDARGLLRVAYAPTRKPETRAPASAQVAAASEPREPTPAPVDVPRESTVSEDGPVAAAPVEAEPVQTSEPAEPAPPTPAPPTPAAVDTAPQVVERVPSLKEMPSIEFALNQSTPSNEAAVLRTVEILLAHPEVKKLQVRGHSDDTGAANYNLRLSLERARGVARYLTDHGVPSDKLETRGVGSSEPLVPGQTAAVRAKNRRVEIIPIMR